MGAAIQLICCRRRSSFHHHGGCVRCGRTVTVAAVYGTKWCWRVAACLVPGDAARGQHPDRDPVPALTFTVLALAGVRRVGGNCDLGVVRGMLAAAPFNAQPLQLTPRVTTRVLRQLGAMLAAQQQHCQVKQLVFAGPMAKPVSAVAGAAADTAERFVAAASAFRCLRSLVVRDRPALLLRALCDGGCRTLRSFDAAWSDVPRDAILQVAVRFPGLRRACG
jgi:hypothetical protein